MPESLDPMSSGGTGMSLVRMLAGEIDGELAFERIKGTRISLLVRTGPGPS